MAFIVTRRGRRNEIRESATTEAGPRNRTLATFDVLTDEVLAHAAARATTPIDAGQLRAAARRVGLEVELPAAEQAARALVAALQRGDDLSPALAGVLAAQLGERDRAPVSDAARAAAEWADASPADHGAALVDLLLLGDALPMPQGRRRRRTVASVEFEEVTGDAMQEQPTFPRLVSTPHVR